MCYGLFGMHACLERQPIYFTANATVEARHRAWTDAWGLDDGIFGLFVWGQMRDSIDIDP